MAAFTLLSSVNVVAAFLAFLVFQLVLNDVKWVKAAESTRTDELAFTVMHALNEQEEGTKASTFVPRGVIIVKSLKASNGVFVQKHLLSRQDKDNIKALATKKSLYQIKIQSEGAPDGSHATDVSTFTRACALYASDLSETITLSVDNTGHVYGVSLTVPVGECNGETAKKPASKLPALFNTTVIISPQSGGPLPDTQTYIQRIEKEKQDRASGKTKDNRSFLAKYWMYIVPVVIFVMLSSQQPEQQGGEGASN